jgi:hypothetical protein
MNKNIVLNICIMANVSKFRLVLKSIKHYDSTKNMEISFYEHMKQIANFCLKEFNKN